MVRRPRDQDWRRFSAEVFFGERGDEDGSFPLMEKHLPAVLEVISLTLMFDPGLTEASLNAQASILVRFANCKRVSNVFVIDLDGTVLLAS